MKAFVLGAVTGAVAMFLWGRQIEESLGVKTRELRIHFERLGMTPSLAERAAAHPVG